MCRLVDTGRLYGYHGGYSASHVLHSFPPIHYAHFLLLAALADVFDLCCGVSLGVGRALDPDIVLLTYLLCEKAQ